MLLEKIIIQNFKSVHNLEIKVIKYNNSNTTFLLGVNEAGKSNILKAMSFFNPDLSKEYNYDLLKNQKDEESTYIDFYYHLKFKDKKTYLEKIKKLIINAKDFELDFDISNIEKNVYLKKGEENFDYGYEFNIDNITPNLYIRKNSKNILELSKSNDNETYKELNNSIFIEYAYELIADVILECEPKVSFWKPSSEYLISKIDLNEFQKDINSNIPLKNIFALVGYTTTKQVTEQISHISNNQFRRKLMSLLSVETTKYIKSIWKHNIEFDIEITENKLCSVSIKDDGQNNRHNFFEMSTRSEGFKQFISLILSLSIETKKLNRKDRLILIDEPETHLHPSGIRDLGKELISIGEKNFLFVSTHSPFIIDQENKQRHIIIKKDEYANTIKKEINVYDDLKDDEVLSEAFGINIYKDLLIPSRILVEGASDKLILSKLFNTCQLDYGVINGIGSNIVQIASRLNTDNIDILVLVDSDKDGLDYKQKILKIGGVFNSENVFSLKDLVPESVKNCTIEDFLGKGYIESQFNILYKEKYNEDLNIELDESKNFIEQIKIYLRKEKGFDNNKLKEFLEFLKIRISEEIKFQKSSWKTKFPLLDKLINIMKIKISN